ncbi:hypothetical protein KCU95_g72, partial [Aureobasidium melanogenum]
MVTENSFIDSVPAHCQSCVTLLLGLTPLAVGRRFNRDWTTNLTQCSKIARKNRETVLTWLTEARNEPLPERGDGNFGWQACA